MTLHSHSKQLLCIKHTCIKHTAHRCQTTTMFGSYKFLSTIYQADDVVSMSKPRVANDTRPIHDRKIVPAQAISRQDTSKCVCLCKYKKYQSFNTAVPVFYPFLRSPHCASTSFPSPGQLFGTNTANGSEN